MGGWWFNLRIKWSGVQTIDKKHGRVILIFSSLVYGLPVLLYTTIASFFQSDYWTFSSSESDIALITCVVVYLWSIFIGYRGIISYFNTKKFRTILWFIILPLVFWICLVCLSIIVFLYKDGVLS